MTLVDDVKNPLKSAKEKLTKERADVDNTLSRIELAVRQHTELDQKILREQDKTKLKSFRKQRRMKHNELKELFKSLKNEVTQWALASLFYKNVQKNEVKENNKEVVTVEKINYNADSNSSHSNS